MWWILAGCVPGLAVVDFEENLPAEPAPVVPTSPVVPTPVDDCVPLAMQPDLSPSWSVEIEEYDVRPGFFGFQSDDMYVSFLSFDPAARALNVLPEFHSVRERESWGDLIALGPDHVELKLDEAGRIAWHHGAQSGVIMNTGPYDWPIWAGANERWWIVIDAAGVFAWDTTPFIVAGQNTGMLELEENWWAMEFALDGDLLWALDRDAAVLHRIDLEAEALSSFTVEDGGPNDFGLGGVFGLEIGPEGAVYTRADHLRVQLDRQGREISRWSGGFARINEMIYATPWLASPIAWSPDGRWMVEMDVEAHLQIRQRCTGEVVLKLEPVEVDRWGLSMDVAELAWSSDGARIGVRMEGAVVFYDLPEGL